MVLTHSAVQVLRDFGVRPCDEAAALHYFRSAPNIYPELKPLAIYHRYA